MPECDLYKKALHIVVEGTETRMRYNGEQWIYDEYFRGKQVQLRHKFNLVLTLGSNSMVR